MFNFFFFGVEDSIIRVSHTFEKVHVFTTLNPKIVFEKNINYMLSTHEIWYIYVILVIIFNLSLAFILFSHLNFKHVRSSIRPTINKKKHI
jgi:hypothetical protein